MIEIITTIQVDFQELMNIRSPHFQLWIWIKLIFILIYLLSLRLLE